jgi:ubiquinone/menaquinone biosynthesis methyltransferase
MTSPFQDLPPDELLNQKQHVPDQFDHIARGYDLATFFSQGYSKDLALSVRRMGLRGDEYLADLCCGTGKSTACCMEALPAGKVIGIDNSREMLAIARRKFEDHQNSKKVQFLQKDVMELDFPDHTFDAIFMAYGIRNMPDYEKCLKNLQRQLKPGGIICLHEYALADKPAVRLYWRLLGYFIIIPFSALLTGSTTIFRYLVRSVLQFPSPQKFLELLQNTGFQDIRVVPLAGWRRPILYTFIARKAGITLQ